MVKINVRIHILNRYTKGIKYEYTIKFAQVSAIIRFVNTTIRTEVMAL